MDPASASVALVGFAASLATLAALVIDTSTTIYNAQRRFKSAPDDINGLLIQLREFKCLLDEVRRHVQDHQGPYGSPAIGALIANTADRMHTDMATFKSVMERLNAVLAVPASPRRILALRIRYILQESVVQEHQRLISSHMGVLTVLLEMLNA